MNEIDALHDYLSSSEPRAEVTTLLRMPLATRRHIKILAADYGVTMNQFMLELMSEGYGPLMRKWEQEEES